jgi:hypothetical protein
MAVELSGLARVNLSTRHFDNTNGSTCALAGLASYTVRGQKEWAYFQEYRRLALDGVKLIAG